MTSTLNLFFALTAFAFVSAFDFCSEGLCCPGSRHIACGHNGQFAPSCPKSAHLVDLNPYIELIVNQHNRKRDLIAGGKLQGFPAAARMATMQWDEVLAFLAALSVKECNRNNKCHNTKAFKHSGQNSAVWSTLVTYYQNVAINYRQIKRAINGWFDQYNFTERSIIDSYAINLGERNSDFLLMVNDQNDRVGCAALGYNEEKENTQTWRRYLLVCNAGRRLRSPGVQYEFKCRCGLQDRRQYPIQKPVLHC